MNLLYDLARYRYVKAGHHVLEIGSGNGALLRSLVDALPQAHFTAIDVYKPEHFPDRAVFIEGDVEHMALKGVYDVVVLNNVLEHMKNPIGLLEKIKTHLHSNGVLLITVPNRYGWNNEARVYIPSHGKHYFLYDRENLQFMLERIGYAIRFHNLFGEHNKSIFVQLFLRLFRIQNPMLTLAAFPDIPFAGSAAYERAQ